MRYVSSPPRSEPSARRVIQDVSRLLDFDSPIYSGPCALALLESTPVFLSVTPQPFLHPKLLEKMPRGQAVRTLRGRLAKIPHAQPLSVFAALA